MNFDDEKDLKQLNKIKNGKKMGKKRQKPPVFFVCPQIRPDYENRVFGSRSGSTPQTKKSPFARGNKISL